MPVLPRAAGLDVKRLDLLSLQPVPHAGGDKLGPVVGCCCAAVRATPLNRLLFMFCSFFEQNSSYVTSPFWGSGQISNPALLARSSESIDRSGIWTFALGAAVLLTPPTEWREHRT